MATATINNRNGMFRKKRVFFTQVSNTAIRDVNLSGKAKGLYSLIQSFITIENFTLYKNTLKKHMMEGEKAFEGMWKELKEKGYLIQHKMQSKKGYFFYEYELLDEPNIELANEIHNPKKVTKTSHSNHTPKKEVVDDEPSGKVGVFNNTNLNNTDLNNTYSNKYSSSIEEIEEDKNNDKVKIKEVVKETVEVENNEDLNTLVQLCQNLEFRLKKDTMKSLLKIFSLDDITRAITTIVSTATFIEGKVKNYSAYLLKTLNDFKTAKNVTINNNIINKPKELAFTNYSQREYDYDTLEKQLLGWDD